MSMAKKKWEGRFFAIKNNKIVVEISTFRDHKNRFDEMVREHNWDSWVEVNQKSARLLLSL